MKYLVAVVFIHSIIVILSVQHRCPQMINGTVIPELSKRFQWFKMRDNRNVRNRQLIISIRNINH